MSSTEDPSQKPSNRSTSGSLSLNGKHVLVLGMARQGKALGRWLPSQGAKVTLSDQRDAGDLADDLLEFILESDVKFALGGHPIELLDEADVVCLSGGVPVDLPIVQAAYEREIPVTNDAILFMERCPAKVIGITGSAGKTTTTSLVGEMGKQSGRKTWVGGNIGNVLLDDLDSISPDDLVVMELSSFQLEIANVSPHIATLLNVTPNHLDRHRTIEAYAAAKSHIFRHQSPDDILIYGRDNILASTLADMSPGQRAAFSVMSLVSDGACMVGRRLVINGNCSPTGLSKIICNRDEVKLPGTHNLSNVAAACAIAGAADISPEAMREAILNFKGVPHRLEIVDVINNITWVNDSIATSPERVIAALNSFDRPIILLAGGRDKDLPWSDLAKLATQRCKSVICFGEYGPQIAKHITHAQRYTLSGTLRSTNTVTDLKAAVEMASKVADDGDLVLLSPGGTSFDAYEDFSERGEHFRKLVKRLKRQQ